MNALFNNVTLVTYRWKNRIYDFHNNTTRNNAKIIDHVYFTTQKGALTESQIPRVGSTFIYACMLVERNNIWFIDKYK